MKHNSNRCLWQIPFIGTLFVLSVWPLNSRGVAQIVPDGTLPDRSVVTSNGNRFTIEGGTTAGGNLFHSFTEFSLPTGNEAFFNNSLTIENIISRITGGKISNVDGLIRANGIANLFLINPNGIVFGPNASLNIGGSFIGTTANSFLFEDGSSYSALNPEVTPLLSVKVPIGLQLGSNSGAIRVEGNGHSLTLENPIFSAIAGAGNTQAGLGVQPGKTLALVGGHLLLSGGLLTAPGGRIELGSVDSGRVHLTSNVLNSTFSYEGVQNFRDIEMHQKALADASGEDPGSIQVQGRHITLTDGSLILIQNQGDRPGGSIRLDAAESLQIRGITSDGRIRSGLAVETVGLGNGGDVTVSTSRSLLQSGARINTATFSSAKAANIIVNTSDFLLLSEASPLNPSANSAITASTFSEGNAGDITLSTRQLTLLNGGLISAPSLGTGSGGNVNVNASESVEVIGVNASNTQFSTLGSTAFNIGDAGTLTIETRDLVLRNGGSITSSTFAIGSAGNIVVNASESVQMSGTAGSGRRSFIESSAIPLNERSQQLFRVPPVLSGASGNVTLNTPVLRLTDGTQIGVRNEGSGDGGSVAIAADSVAIAARSNITAATTSGEGGNISLTVRDALQLSNESQITTSAGGIGNGGNMTIDAGTIVSLQNSDIIANALQGRGGQIQINTLGIFGTEFREGQTPASDITASSRFGVSGTVTLTNPSLNPSSGLLEMPSEVPEATQQVVVGCAADKGNTFTVTGRSGLPEDPTQTIRGQTVWRDLQDFSTASAISGQFSAQTPAAIPNRAPPLVEATSWEIDARGQVVLLAHVPHARSQSTWSRLPECNKF